MNYYKKGCLYVPDYNQVVDWLIPAPELRHHNPDRYIEIYYSPPFDPKEYLGDAKDLPKADRSERIILKRDTIGFNHASRGPIQVQCWTRYD